MKVRLLIVLTVVVSLSAAARLIHHQKIPWPDHAAWITTDADTLYHFRRTDRALDEGHVAPTDERLNYPHGSAIPWPPYYTYLTTAFAAPGAPDDAEARRGHIERRVASLPFWFGLLASLLAVFAARALFPAGSRAADAAGLIAGGAHALSIGSIAYSKVGNGDHHAWITLLAGVLLWGTAAALRDTPHGGGKEKGAAAAGSGAAAVRRALWLGAGLGVVAGTMLGSWVASVLYVLPVQLVIGWWIVLNGRRAEPGVAPFGTAFHAAAFLTLLPAILGSPWNDVNPWMVVNLTWFHGAWLLLGGAVCVPLFLVRGAAARAYPWIAAGALAAVGLLLALTDLGPAAGIREGFGWMGREDAFMSSVWESRGLIGENAVFSPFEVLGTGAYLIPFLALGLVFAAFFRGRRELLPWAVAFPLLAAQALRQLRFGDALALPLAVAGAWGLVAFVMSDRGRAALPKALTRAKSRAAATWTAAAAGILFLQPFSAQRLASHAVTGQRDSPSHPSAVVMRELCDWIRFNSEPGDWSVLGRWTWGHAIEWGAARPSVGTNFGTFVGEDSFRDPTRFLMEEDPAAAERRLAERRSRYVVVTSYLPGSVTQMVDNAAPERRARYLDPGPTDQANLRFEWFRTLGARLIYDGAVITERGPVGALDFLRLVYVSPSRDPRPNPRGAPSPGGWIWEHVPGARLTARGNPGDELTVRLRLQYPTGRYEWHWIAGAECGEDGTATLRIPYATDAPNGDARVAETEWSFRERTGPERTGTLTVPEAAVRAGSVLDLPESGR